MRFRCRLRVAPPITLLLPLTAIPATTPEVMEQRLTCSPSTWFALPEMVRQLKFNACPSTITVAPMPLITSLLELRSGRVDESEIGIEPLKPAPRLNRITSEFEAPR